MFKKLFALILCVLVLFSVACKADSAEEHYDVLFDTYPKIFVTENITRITFYGHYGLDFGSTVPKKHMPEIITWLDSFTVDSVFTDELIPPGTNTYKVKIEYSDGTVIMESLDLVSINGTLYSTTSGPIPDCFWKII